MAGEVKELDLSWNVQLGAFEYFDRVGWPMEREPLRVRKTELLNDPKLFNLLAHRSRGPMDCQCRTARSIVRCLRTPDGSHGIWLFPGESAGIGTLRSD
jgi:hypothetical protein